MDRRSLLQTMAAAPAAPAGVRAADPLFEIGCLDVTKAPYYADPAGKKDSTAAIQRAVNDARDKQLVCFFPRGTYLISHTISCEQPVRKLDKPRFADNQRQSYWDVPNRKCVLIGSTAGERPVIRLAPDAKGFSDPAKPRMAVYIWAQTRNDAPGKAEPEWGKEQPNISFGHIFKGIDIDVRGHAGAVGIRHSGSQGSTLQDSRILAGGAYAGMSNCCGQGGGTHNIEVTGGRYGIVIDRGSRFPLLNACAFRGQTEAVVRYARGGTQVPTLLVGCLLEPAGACAVDLTTENLAGISMVDCVVAMKPGGVLCKSGKNENIYLEDTFVRGVLQVRSGGPRVPYQPGWTRIVRYSAHTERGVNLINGVQSAGEVVEWERAAAEPSFAAVRARHYARTPSFEDAGAVNVKTFGAKGDGVADDTAAFEKAISRHDRIFVPKGSYKLTGTLRLRSGTQLFALSREFVSIGSVDVPRSPGAAAQDRSTFSLVTPDTVEASPGLWFLSVRGDVDWRSGQGVYMLASGNLTISGNGGGRFYGLMAMRRALVLRNVRRPASFYAINVERVLSNPQAEFSGCSHLRFYYFKVEAGTALGAKGADANTPCRIANSQDVRVYCMCGVVWKLGQRPMFDVEDSDSIVISQLKTFRPGEFPLLKETRAGVATSLPSSSECALFVRGARNEAE